MSWSLDLLVKAAGPIRELAATLRPGVFVARGRNGSGKSTLLRLLGLFPKRVLSAGDLPVTWGENGARASVELGRARMTAELGEAPHREGQGTLPPIGAIPEPLAALEHGERRKDDDARWKARLRGLLKVVQVAGTPDAWARIAPPGLVAWAREELAEEGDLLRGAERIRARIHELRREEEAKLEDEDRKADIERAAASEALAAGEMDAETAQSFAPPEHFRERVERQERELEELERRRAAYTAEMERRERLRERLDEPPPLARAEAAVEDAKNAHIRDVKEADAAVDRVAELTARLAKAEEELRSRREKALASERKLEASRKALDELRDRHARHEALREELDATPPEAPTEEALEARRRALAEWNSQGQRAVHAAKARERLAACELHIQERERHRQAAKVWEAEANEVWEELARWVNRHIRSPLVRLEGTEIQVKVGSDWWSIDNETAVSEGERALACYDLLLRQQEGARIVTVPGATPLSPDTRLALVPLAREVEACLIVECPEDAGELALEEVGGG